MTVPKRPPAAFSSSSVERFNREVSFSRQQTPSLCVAIIAFLGSAMMLIVTTTAAAALSLPATTELVSSHQETAKMALHVNLPSKTGMKITLEISGGFAAVPGLSRPITIDTTRLEPSVAKELTDLVHSSAFFARPSRISTVQPGAADYQSYRIEIQEGSTIHSVELTDPVTDPVLSQLLNKLQEVVNQR
mgnify:CR=1 FL=1